MKKILILLLSCVLITLNVTACASKENKLIGTWEMEIAYKNDNGNKLYIENYYEKAKYGVDHCRKIEFFSDGTCKVDGEYGTWKITDNKLFVLGQYGGEFWSSSSISGEFKVSRNKLEFFDASIDGGSDNINLIYKKIS